METTSISMYHATDGVPSVPMQAGYYMCFYVTPAAPAAPAQSVQYPGAPGAPVDTLAAPYPEQVEQKLGKQKQEVDGWIRVILWCYLLNKYVGIGCVVLICLHMCIHISTVVFPYCHVDPCWTIICSLSLLSACQCHAALVVLLFVPYEN